MANTPLYTGVSSVQGLGNLYDIALVKQDLQNAINTRKGERLMNPEYGSIIWDLLFELKTPSIITEIENDLKRIIESEPRVLLQQMQIVEQEHGYIGLITLYFVQFKTVDQLRLEFNSGAATAGQNQTGS